ncbi:hypothetical protein [Bacillus sp. NPDC094106]|uniref:hypothetical protein n=1 Tax=Bacillus sp. NPDC094106 TaxID=3363949 RepID=UPI00380F4CDE
MDLQINDSILLDVIFDEQENNYPFTLNVLLKFSQPLIWELNYNNETYLVYLLRDKSTQTKNGLITTQELLFSKATTTTVSKLLGSELSISDAFLTSDTIWRAGKIGNKIYPRKSLKSYKEIKDRFPRQGIHLKDIHSI